MALCVSKSLGSTLSKIAKILGSPLLLLIYTQRAGGDILSPGPPLGAESAGFLRKADEPVLEREG